MSSKKISLSGMLIALGVICSTFYIPIGVAKCFPVQHLINVLAGILLGPIYAVAVAFSISFIRVITGLGSILAFPGSMCGALLCGIMYKYTKNIWGGFIGEVIGTGIIGALIAYPIATLFMAKEAVVFGFVIPFGLSSIVGASISVIMIVALKKSGVILKNSTVVED